jgi:leucyl-tRNA synthetase
MPYDHQNIEKKWQQFWEENKTFSTPTESQKPKKYILDMFPYPSGAGLHVGHPKGYTATDIVSRYYHAKWYNVLHPMGFDAFGLPAENYAIKTWTHPAITTAENIATFTEQMKNLWFSYDWDRMVDTTDPEYYKWTQWIFLELFKKWLAYEQDLPINYCPSCKTGLANEEVLSDNTCDRCGTRVERRPIRQWVLKITEYADRLIEDLDWLDWPEGIKEMQRNWIGKSEGCEFRMMKKMEWKPTALLLHGWDDRENRTEWHWMEPTKNELEKMGYEVIMEQLPGNNAPNLDEQLAFLDQYKEKMDDRSVVIGHSMWGFLAMHFVQGLSKKIGSLICVAPIFNGLIHHVDWSKEATGWEIGANSMQKNYDPEKIKNNLSNWHVFLSENDWGITYPEAKKHFESIGGVDIASVPNAGHFTSSDGYATFPDLLECLDHIRVYTTRVDTVYGMTYAVLAPDHPKVEDFITPEQREACTKYIEGVQGKSDLDRTNDGKEKTGVFTWSFVINPYNGESVPLWIADFVLGHYGTGALMAVPGHDERDREFAHLYNLPILQSIETTVSFDNGAWKKEYGEDGKSIALNLSSKDARNTLSKKAETEWFGHKKINYKLRDWLFSRQRYWGEPIPLIHISIEDFENLPRINDTSEATDPNIAYILDKKWTDKRCKNCTCGDVGCTKLIIGGKSYSKVYDGINGKIIIEPNLPLTLPQVEKYEPAGDGQSPLATAPLWVNVKLANNLNGKRETNTMPQWWGSCWYYLRYMDPKNHEALASQASLDYWGIVDEYVGWAEHAVLHLLYARFWHKVLFDAWVVPTKEPFQKLTNVGMILAYAYEREDGGLVAVDLVREQDGKFYEIETGKEVKQVVAKMSKSLKNVVNPNDIVREFGADTLRLYEMSMAGFIDTAPWNPEAIIGVRRFLDRVYATFTEGKNIAKDDMKAMKLLHKTVKKVGEDIVDYKFNTAISALMILQNEWVPSDEDFKIEWREKFLTLLHPFAPHMAEELWMFVHMGDKMDSIYQAPWPSYDEFMLVDDEVTIAVQVNGKLRGTLTCFNGVAQEEVSLLAHADPGIAKWIEGKTLVKEIFIPNKMLSIVVRD